MPYQLHYYFIMFLIYLLLLKWFDSYRKICFPHKTLAFSKPFWLPPDHVRWSVSSFRARSFYTAFLFPFWFSHSIDRSIINRYNIPNHTLYSFEEFHSTSGFELMQSCIQVYGNANLGCNVLKLVYYMDGHGTLFRSFGSLTSML